MNVMIYLRKYECEYSSLYCLPLFINSLGWSQKKKVLAVFLASLLMLYLALSC